MSKLRGKELSKLYPNPKSFNELETEQRIREERRKPRFVVLKISTWSILAIGLVIGAYWLISFIIMHNLSSAGDVIFAVFSSFFIAMATLAIVLYLGWSIRELLRRA